MDPQKAIQEFFNFDQPCPPEIPLCEQIRESFKTELNKLEGTSGCSSCAKARLKSRFVEAIFKEITSNNK